MEKYYVKISGIYCNHCKETIEKAIRGIPGVSAVRVQGNVACVTAKGNLSRKIEAAVTRAGYVTKQSWISRGYNRWRLLECGELLAELGGILLLWWLLRLILGYDILNVIPVIDSGISLAAVFMAGLMTSLHCVGMCGAINLVASTSRRNAVIYNLGRVSCYTAVGFLVGLLGKAFSFQSRTLGIFTVCVAAAMLLMGISMTGIITLPQVRCFQENQRKPYGAFIMGILNGFIPCGPLTAMQLYALSTASPLRGGLSLFLFGLGTVPLMLGFGALQSMFQKHRALIQKICALLVVVLACSMLMRGLSMLGMDIQRNSELSGYKVAEVLEDTQQIHITADYGSYEDFAVKVGIPVELVIEMPEEKLTGCNNEIICEELGFSQKLSVGENRILFIPEKSGEYTYSCWMYMIHNRIFVYE